MENKTHSLKYFIIILLIIVVIMEVLFAVIFLESYKKDYFSKVILGEISKNAEQVGFFNEEIISDIILDQKEAINTLLEEMSLMTNSKVVYEKNYGLSGYSGFGDNQQFYYTFLRDKLSYSIVLPIISMGEKYGYFVVSGNVNKREIKDLEKMSHIFLFVNIFFVVAIAIAIYKLFYYFMYRPLHVVIENMSQYKIYDKHYPSRAKKYGIVISEIKSLEQHLYTIAEEMREKASLVAIGQTTAMVAHDVRKPLASTKALLKILPSIKDDPGQLAKMMVSVDNNIERTNTMLNDILEFSRDATALELKDHDPQSIITAALAEAMRIHLKSDVSIEYDLRHKDYLKVDRDRIIRVLTNIIDNALDAMNDGTGHFRGRIWIRTESRPGNIVITVGDDGSPIPDDNLSRIFDPFFTHGKKGGTGLGLAICQKVIQMHGGKIEAKSSKDMTEFEITLPSHEGELSINESELIYHSKEFDLFRIEEEARPDYGETLSTAEFMEINKARGRESSLLIVDDEPLFRETVRHLINSLPQVRDHVKVIETERAESALRLLEEQQFDYVIADIDLGKRRMDGYEFSQVVLERYPNTYVLIHSNKRRDELDKNIRQVESDKFMGFLPKPMNQSELLQFLACKTFDPPATRASPSALASLKACRVDGSKARRAGASKHVLILNDDEDMLISMKMILRAHGVQVLEASNVSTALKRFTDNRVDIILSDINLGEGEENGYDFLRKVREAGNSVPFYMVSGYSSQEHEPKALGLGANGYLQLPLDDVQLKGILQ